MQSPKTDPYKYSQLIFLQKHKVNSMEKAQSFQYIVLQQWNIYMEKAEPQSVPHSLSKNK